MRQRRRRTGDAGPAAAGTELASTTTPAFRPGGAGPLYWSTYGYEYLENTLIPEDVWKTNVDWVASTFRDYGYNMVCTDGWIDDTQRITPHGYIVSQADDWVHDWSWWVSYLRAKGLELGVYYNPLWATKSAITNPSVTVVGRPDVKVADIVNPGDYFDGGGRLQWVDATRDGAEEYVKGYVAYFRQLGVVFLRIDFLGWYEAGFDQSEGTVGVAHGRESYLQALEWMRDAAGDMQLSLVLPNLFDHGSGERRFGDLIRIDNDASFGTWINLSEGRQGWQPIWSQWNNPFLGFTGFSDVSGRGQLILDGDPLLMSSFADDGEKQTAVNLFTMAGAPIAIIDRADTIGDNASFFQNREVLALRKAGLAGKPVFNNSHGFEYDPSSRDPERWIGQLPDGSWAVGSVQPPGRPGHPDHVDRFRRCPRLHRSGCGPRLVGPPGPGLDDQLPGEPGPPRLGPVVGGSPRPRPLPGRGRGLGRISPVREHLCRPPRHGLRHRPRYRGEQCGRGHVRAQRRPSPTPIPRGQLHRHSVENDGTGTRPDHRRPPRHGHPRGAEHVGLDVVADRPGHPDHGAWHQPGGVQRRDI